MSSFQDVKSDSPSLFKAMCVYVFLLLSCFLTSTVALCFFVFCLPFPILFPSASFPFLTPPFYCFVLTADESVII